MDEGEELGRRKDHESKITECVAHGDGFRLLEEVYRCVRVSRMDGAVSKDDKSEEEVGEDDDVKHHWDVQLEPLSFKSWREFFVGHFFFLLIIIIISVSKIHLGEC